MKKTKQLFLIFILLSSAYSLNSSNSSHDNLKDDFESTWRNVDIPEEEEKKRRAYHKFVGEKIITQISSHCPNLQEEKRFSNHKNMITEFNMIPNFKWVASYLCYEKVSEEDKSKILVSKDLLNNIKLQKEYAKVLDFQVAAHRRIMEQFKTQYALEHSHHLPFRGEMVKNGCITSTISSLKHSAKDINSDYLNHKKVLALIKRRNTKALDLDFISYSDTDSEID